MTVAARLDALHSVVKRNRWMRYFAIFCRVSLAAGFIPAGWVKITGERFTNLHNNQPMGHYLEALFHTGYYYPFIGYLQIIAGVFLLIPRLALLGVFIYFPIILNILILSLSVRFEGSLPTAPMMVMACLFLLCWDYDRVKYILPIYKAEPLPQPAVVDNSFPYKFFAGVVVFIVGFFAILTHSFDIMPRNTLKDCRNQCHRREDPAACQVFCEQVHVQGQPLPKALEQYRAAVAKKHIED